MAIAFVAAGTPIGGNTGSTGLLINVPIPAGLAANQLLVMTVLTDDTKGPTTPSGWKKLGSQATANSPTLSPYYAPPRLTVLYKIATGTEGATVGVTFDFHSWPNGYPYYVASIVSYSGTDLTAPIGEWGSTSNVLSLFALNHNIITTSVNSDWLLTVRGGSGNTGAATYTISGGTNSERIDATDGIPELSMSVYDSNGALATGAQTQRVTTASAAPNFGSVGFSIAIRPPTSTQVLATPDEANAIGTAYNPSLVIVNGPWDTCASMPPYAFMVDWNGDNSLQTPGGNLVPNSYFTTGITGWALNADTLVWSSDFIVNKQGFYTMKIVPNGSTAVGGANQTPRSPVGSVVAGNTYVADAWVYSPGGWSDLRTCVDWFDASDAFLSTSLGVGSVVAAGVWAHLVQTFTAPASASRPSLRIRHGGTPPVTAIYYVYGAILVDPTLPGTFMAPAPGENITPDILDGGISIAYGRDQSRQLSPTKTGTASLSLNNVGRSYSPENTTGPLYGDLDPARYMRGEVSFLGTTYALGRMRIDDYNITADIDNRTLDLTFLDGMKSLDGVTLSTGVLSSMRTGDLINYILDQANWTGPRDVDPGATVVTWWWVEAVTALTAIQDLVLSEGPPAIAYVALDGTFIFRDRHHRILRTPSVVPQAYFSQNKLNDCTSPAATGTSFTAPFQYAHGWRDIVNSVSFDVSIRQPITGVAQVWQSGNTINLALGQSVTVTASGSDPFVNAITPVSGTDYTATGVGTVQVTMSRTSGQSVDLTLLAIGGSVSISGLQVRAQSIPVVNTVPVSRQDSTSIAGHGEQPYPNPAPWATVEDAFAIAGIILLRYAQRRPTVQLRITASDPRHLWEILNRKISDRIHITYGEMGLDADFFIETVTHQISRMNKTNQPPVHSVIFGCEKDLGASTANPFRFDTRGSGFDQGQFDPLVGDNASTVFVFDDPRGAFDLGVFGT